MKKLNNVRVKEQYDIEVSDRCKSVESLDDCVGIIMIWESIKESRKSLAKTHTPVLS